MATVGIAEAALRLGISQDTVRRRIKAGKLTGEKVEVAAPGGYRWLVDIPDEGQEPEYTLSSHNGEITALRELLKALRAHNELLQKQIETKDREIEQLQSLLQRQAQAIHPDSTLRRLFSIRRDQR